MRLFFAVWPPPALARALHRWALAARAACGGRVTREETIHLTLAFLGDVPAARVSEAIACAAGVRGGAFDLELDEARHWAHNEIVWAGPCAMPAALADLAAQLGAAPAAGGFRIEARAFKAHITLLRRAAKDGALPPLPPLHPRAWHADEFVLVRSAPSAAGPAYEVLARFKLGDGAALRGTDG